MYKRSLTDVKFQAAQEDDLAANDGMPRVFELVEKSDLVKGVYEAPVAFGEATAPVEADIELPEGRMREVLECVARRSRMFAGDWAGLVVGSIVGMIG
ncbi:hypothetical protein BC936DRAFT_139972, partial [Jimgerdemannia flammicorona]